MKRLMLLVLACLCVLPIYAQNGGAVDTGVYTTDFLYGKKVLMAMPGSSVYVCAKPASGNPCSNTITVYSDDMLTQPLAQPLLVDENSRVLFYAAAGEYQYTVSTPKGKNYGPYTVTVPNPGASASVNGQDISPKSVNNVVNAAGYDGSDCGAKINAADTAWLGTPVEIDVTRACGTTFTTPIVLTSGHNLKWTQGGNYTLPINNVVLGNNVVDFGSATIQLTAQAVTPAFNTALWITNQGSTAAANVIFQNGTLDGNYDNVPLNNCYHAAPCSSAITINGTTSQAVHDITVQNIKFQNWVGWTIWMDAVVNNSLEPYNIHIKGNSFTKNSGHTIYIISFDHNVEISNNTFTGWAAAGGYADAIGTVNYDTPGGPTHDRLDVIGNTFTSTYLPAGGNGNYVMEVDPTGGWTTHFRFERNVVKGVAGYIELSISADHAIISNNTWENSGPSELGISHSVVSDNNIKNGRIVVMPSRVVSSDAASDNVISNNVIANSTDPNSKAILISGGDSASTGNTIVSNNTIDMSGSTGACEGILVGPYDAVGYVRNIQITNNTLTKSSLGCAGIRLATVASPVSSGIEIRGNTVVGFNAGIDGDAYATDVTIADNKLLRNAQAIADFTGPAPRQWGNVVSISDDTQHLNGVALVTSTGQGAFPVGIANGTLGKPPFSNLTAWYPASAVCSVDGSTLTSWADSSGNGNTLTGGTNKAICETNIINGQAVVRFAGTESGYSATLTPSLSGLSTTVFAVYHKTVGASSATLFDDLVFPAYYSMWYETATSLKTQAVDSLTVTVPDDDKVHVAAYSLSSAGAAKMYFDGALIASGSQLGVGLGGITVGARQTGDNSWNGDIAEVLVYGSELTSSEVQAVGAYLSSKYGLRQAGTWSINGGVGSFGTSVESPIGTFDNHKGQTVTTDSIAGSSSAEITLTWTLPFADATYAPSCSVIVAGSNGATLRVHHISEVQADHIKAVVVNDDSSAHTGTLSCNAH